MTLDDEIDLNFSFLMANMANWLPEHRGRYALLRRQRAEGFFATPGAALEEGQRRFADGIFSVQEIDPTTIDLGYYSYVAGERHAIQ